MPTESPKIPEPPAPPAVKAKIDPYTKKQILTQADYDAYLHEYRKREQANARLDEFLKKAKEILQGVSFMVLVLMFLSGATSAGSVIKNYFPPLISDVISWVLFLICVYAVYMIDHEQRKRADHLESQLKLYRWEAQRLKEAAENAIRIDMTAPLVGTLKDVANMEADCTDPQA